MEQQRNNNDMSCDLAQSFTIMPATLGNTQVFDSVTGRASKVPPEMAIDSYRSNSGSRYGANSNQIDKQPYNSSYLRDALKSSQLSQRGCRGGERIERVSDLPVEFKSQFAERNQLKAYIQPNMTMTRDDSEFSMVERIPTLPTKGFHT